MLANVFGSLEPAISKDELVLHRNQFRLTDVEPECHPAAHLQMCSEVWQRHVKVVGKVSRTSEVAYWLCKLR